VGSVEEVLPALGIDAPAPAPLRAAASTGGGI
jgi:hypothetical protein